MIRRFAPAAGVTLVGIGLATAYGGPAAVFPIVALAVLEVSLSFDNAVVNATVLQRMSRGWRVAFLTVGIVMAVFVIRLLLPFAIVAIVAGLSPAQTLHLALQHGPPSLPGTFGFVLEQAHPEIAAFGGTFLLMLFFDFALTKKEVHWLHWVERPLESAGQFKNLAVAATIAAVMLVAVLALSNTGMILMSALAGLLIYFALSGLGDLLQPPSAATGNAGLATGAAGLVLFLYLELLDASFSLDGVVGAFALSADPILIAIGLGIGAMFVRALTVLFVEKGTLQTFPYLEHGGFWAIGALGTLLLVSITINVPQLVSGTVGIVFIGGAFLSSLTAHPAKPHTASS